MNQSMVMQKHLKESYMSSFPKESQAHYKTSRASGS
jgi:hypothetical protein